MAPKHAAELEPLLLDPLVYATLHPAAPPTAADVLAHAQAKHEQWEHHGVGYWLVRDRATGEVTGRGGLQRSDLDSGAAIEAGWAIMPRRWRGSGDRARPDGRTGGIARAAGRSAVERKATAEAGARLRNAKLRPL
jgi:RimJ/RimL family protein N-acetyltransferase